MDPNMQAYSITRSTATIHRPPLLLQHAINATTLKLHYAIDATTPTRFGSTTLATCEHITINLHSFIYNLSLHNLRHMGRGSTVVCRDHTLASHASLPRRWRNLCCARTHRMPQIHEPVHQSTPSFLLHLVGCGRTFRCGG
ncbi:hypothetical protein Pcinc_034937 [Petrolisthes cinctipes]|uniref:Uncharacterized protein n=1 Tax=Petrolisthes cinctipes TaxID=88211 RepID=A0AAE1C0Q3_PETCI|nr:hypothetical protein Pcinc_034937 [Petrolisthes cinctipes]